MSDEAELTVAEIYAMSDTLAAYERCGTSSGPLRTKWRLLIDAALQSRRSLSPATERCKAIIQDTEPTPGLSDYALGKRWAAQYILAALPPAPVTPE